MGARPAPRTKARLDGLREKLEAAKIARGLAPPPLLVLNRYEDDTPEIVAADEERAKGAALVVVVHLLRPRPPEAML